MKIFLSKALKDTIDNLSYKLLYLCKQNKQFKITSDMLANTVHTWCICEDKVDEFREVLSSE